MRRDWKGKTVLKHAERRYMSTHTQTSKTKNKTYQYVHCKPTLEISIKRDEQILSNRCAKGYISTQRISSHKTLSFPLLYMINFNCQLCYGISEKVTNHNACKTKVECFRFGQ